MLKIRKMAEVLVPAVLFAGVITLLPFAAGAGTFETSFGLAFSRNNYNEQDYTWNRRWGASVGYFFSETSQIEISFQDIVDRTYITNYQDTTFHDKVYSANWVQGIFGKQYFFQPYVKVGIGQLNRDGTGTYAGGGAPPVRIDSVTGVMGAGARIYLTKRFAFRVEGTSYLEKGSIRNVSKDFAFNVGISAFY